MKILDAGCAQGWYIFDQANGHPENLYEGVEISDSFTFVDTPQGLYNALKGIVIDNLNFRWYIYDTVEKNDLTDTIKYGSMGRKHEFPRAREYGEIVDYVVREAERSPSRKAKLNAPVIDTLTPEWRRGRLYSYAPEMLGKNVKEFLESQMPPLFEDRVSPITSRINITVCDARNMPFADDSFEYSQAIGVPIDAGFDDFLIEMTRVTRPGGDIYITRVPRYMRKEFPAGMHIRVGDYELGAKNRLYIKKAEDRITTLV